MQQLCKSRLSWGEPLVADTHARWVELVNQLHDSNPVTLSRCLLSGPISDMIWYQLVGFCDASNAAYAAVTYMREEISLGTESEFVVCKTRVSPIKLQTIPRLELLSALLLVRVITSISESLK